MSSMKNPHSKDADADLDDVIGRCLGLLDESHHRSVAKESERQNRLMVALDLLMDDGREETLRPPDDLKIRTMKRIQEKKLLRESFQETPVYRPKMRWIDYAIAASVFFAMFLGTIPALQRSRFMASNLACSTNLMQLWRGAEHYSSTFNAYPNAVSHNQQLPVGASLILMKYTGHLNDEVPLTCPCCHRQVQASQLPNWSDLKRLQQSHQTRMNEIFSEAYAVHPGLTGPRGLIHLQRQMIQGYREFVPIFGDAPPTDSEFHVLSGNSRAHGGHGQNVVFADGHVIFARKRRVHHSDNDIYTSRNGMPEPSQDPREMVLLPAGLRLLPR